MFQLLFILLFNSVPSCRPIPISRSHSAEEINKFLSNYPISNVYGGISTNSEECPYSAMLIVVSKCSGIIVSKRWVLTAAVCRGPTKAAADEDDMDNEDGRVRAGSSGCNQTKMEFCENLQERKILQYFRYHTRDPEGDKLQHELMAVKLREAFIFNDFVYKINIREYKLLSPGEILKCYLIALGDNVEEYTPDYFKSPVTVVNYENSSCHENTPWSFLDNGLCTSGNMSFTGGCQGDTGGGLICDGLLTGILFAQTCYDVKHSTECGLSVMNNVYIHVSYYHQWLRLLATDIMFMEVERRQVSAAGSVLRSLATCFLAVWLVQ